MKYSAKVLEQLLLKLQSQHFDRYKDQTIKDMLITLLSQECIANYNEIEWGVFKDDLIGFYKPPTKLERMKDPFCVFNPQSKLEDFLKTCVSQEECVRILTFFRDNADEVLFNNEECPECHDFKKECARLISKYIEQGKRTQYYGHFAEMAHPSLEAIANAQPLPPLSKEEQIIADHIPRYPQESGLFTHEAVMWVANYFVANFCNQLDVFHRTQLDSDKPCMSLQQYKDPIRDRLIQITNRYLYFEHNPIYQVIWAMGVLIRLKPKQDWWTRTFAEKIIEYLDCTKFLCDTKKYMDDAIHQVRRLTELTLFDEPPITHQPTETITCKIQEWDVKKIVEEICARLQQHDGTPPCQLTMNFGNVGQLITNVEQYHCK